MGGGPHSLAHFTDPMISNDLLANPHSQQHQQVCHSIYTLRDLSISYSSYSSACYLAVWSPHIYMGHAVTLYFMQKSTKFNTPSIQLPFNSWKLQFKVTLI